MSATVEEKGKKYSCEKCNTDLLILKNGEVDTPFVNCKHFTIKTLGNGAVRLHPEWVEEYKSLSTFSVKDNEGNMYFVIPRYPEIYNTKGKIYAWKLPSKFDESHVALVKIPEMYIIALYGDTTITMLNEKGISIKKVLKGASKVYKQKYPHKDNPFDYVLKNYLA